MMGERFATQEKGPCSMPSELIRRSLPLMPDEWAHLEQLAETHQALAPTGPTAGQPSWRSLIKEIAQGRFTLTRKPEEAVPDD
jgi:hypothetical protein